MTCAHNQICRYTHGFHCEDCNTFFPKDSPTYRSSQLLSSIWMVLHNLQKPDADAMRDKIGIGEKHENYEALIAEAEVIMAKYKVNSDSATFTLR